MNSTELQMNSLTVMNTLNKPDNRTFIPFTDRNGQPGIQKKTSYETMADKRNCFLNSIYYRIRKSYTISGEGEQKNYSPHYLLDEMELMYGKYNTAIFIFDNDDAPSGRLKSQWNSEFHEGLHLRKLDDKILWKISYRMVEPETSIESVMEDIEFLQEIEKTGEVIVRFTRTPSPVGISASDSSVNRDRLKNSVFLPGCSLADSRLIWLHQFFNLAFQCKDHQRTVLAENLEFAKLDSLMLEKLHPGRYETQVYKKGVHRLIRSASQHCIETLSKIVHFMSSRSEKQIIEDWNFVQCMVQKEKYAQRLITAELGKLIKQNS